MRLNRKTCKALRREANWRAFHSPLQIADGYETRKRLGTREIPVGKDVIKVPILGPIRLNQYSQKWWYRQLKNAHKKGLDV